ncbi:hypothetical protein E5288_WYG001190 [Bos mutus]|uniref:Uncharacterized protein n=1 Tax=Bos mutus TaxID=72004 RepID=A0A6B0S075_9CETA|nr:hypothetical protein [Bos mutus]
MLEAGAAHGFLFLTHSGYLFLTLSGHLFLTPSGFLFLTFSGHLFLTHSGFLFFTPSGFLFLTHGFLFLTFSGYLFLTHSGFLFFTHSGYLSLTHSGFLFLTLSGYLFLTHCEFLFLHIMGACSSHPDNTMGELARRIVKGGPFLMGPSPMSSQVLDLLLEDREAELSEAQEKTGTNNANHVVLRQAGLCRKKGKGGNGQVPLFKESFLKAPSRRRSTFALSMCINPLRKSPLVCSGDKTAALERLKFEYKIDCSLDLNSSNDSQHSFLVKISDSWMVLPISETHTGARRHLSFGEVKIGILPSPRQGPASPYPLLEECRFSLCPGSAAGTRVLTARQDLHSVMDHSTYQSPHEEDASPLPGGTEAAVLAGG